MSFRSTIPDFQLANPLYSAASVSFYTIDVDGASTGVLATLYAAPTGPQTTSNPQILDSDGKFAAPVYIDEPVIAEVVSANVGSHTTGIINARGTYRGGWQTGQIYFSTDFVLDTGTGDIYVVVDHYTSGASVAGDLSAGHLELVFDASDIELLSITSATWGPFTDVASASTVDVGNVATMAVNITGTVPITSFGSAVNRLRVVKTASAVPITAGASLISPVGSFTTKAGQTFLAHSDASGVWRLIGVGLDYLGTGILARTSSGFINRTLTGTANEITVTNGDGAAGNPVISLPASLDFTGKTITGGTFSGITLGGLAFGDGSANAPSVSFTNDTNTGLYKSGADELAVATGGTRRALWDSAGRYLMGAAAAIAIGAFSPLVQINAADATAGISITRWTSGTANAPARLTMGRSRNGTIGSNTIVQSGDAVASILVAGDDGTDVASELARIDFVVDGSPNVNEMPGRIAFATTSAGASMATVRLLLDSSGILKPNTDDGVALGTATLGFSDLFFASGAVVGFNNGDVTLTHSSDALTLAGGSLVLPSAGLTVGASVPFSDSAGTLTLQNVDALDATTESTIEAAIDTLANLTSIQGQTFTLTGAFIRSGAHSLTLTTTNTTSLTLPTSGTLTTTSDNLGAFASTTSAQLRGVLSDETGTGVAVFGTSPSITTSMLFDSGFVMNWNAGDVTLTHSANALTLAGGSLVLPDTGLTVGASVPFSDSAGTLTLQNVDAIDATTESTIEAAIDTLANLTSIQGFTFTLTGNFIRSGAHSLTLTTTGATSLTLPTSGTLTTTGNKLGDFAATSSAELSGVISDETGSGVLVFGTSPTFTTSMLFSSGFVMNWNAGDLTLTHSSNALTLAGGTLVLPSSGLQVGASVPFLDSAGVLTLQNVDALDATTESTIEAAIDTLANLTSVQGRTVTYTDAGIDELWGWDDSAGGGTGAYKNFAVTEIATEGTPAAGDWVLIYGAEGDLRKVDWDNLPGGEGGGLANVEEDTSPTLGGNLNDGGFDLVTTGSFGINRDDGSTDTVLNVLTLQRTSTGTPANGIGVGINFTVETTAGNNEIGATIEAITSDITSTSEDFYLSLKVMVAGSAATEVGRFTSAGLVVGNTGLTVGSSVPFSDSTGTLTLQNIDALDATTESTIEAAIDTLANLTSIQGRTVTLADAGADVIFGWDDSGSAYKNFALADLTDEGSPDSGDYVLIYGAEGDLRKTNWDNLPGGGSGLGSVAEDTSPELGGTLDANTFSILFDDNTGLKDDSGNEQLILQKTASAVNHWEMTNAATGNAPLLQAVGDDTDVAARISSKGAGSVHLAIDGTNEVTLTAAAFSPTTNDGNALGTTSLGWADLHLATGGVINWANGEVTLTETDANTLTLVGGTLVLPASGLQVGSSNPFSDAAGTLTLQNVDALDATTEATIEAAIDTLANLTSIQGNTVTLTGDFIRSGAHSLTITTAGATSITLPTSGTLSTIDAANWTATIKPFGKQGIYIPASAMVARTTNGAATFSTELATNDVMIHGYDFDTSTVEGVQFFFALPKQWDESTVTFRAYWTAASGSGTVAWALAGASRSDDDAMDQAYGTAQTVTDTLITANDMHVTAESSAITIAGTPAEGDHQFFLVTRETGSDTLGVDARLLGIEFFVTTNAANDG